MSTVELPEPLAKAIEDADASVLRELIKKLCNESTIALERTTKMLTSDNDAATAAANKDDEMDIELSHEIEAELDAEIQNMPEPPNGNGDGNETQRPDAKRRKIDYYTDGPQYRRCKVCNKNFNMDKNHDKACQAHPGKVCPKMVMSQTEEQSVTMTEDAVIDSFVEWFPRDAGFAWSCCQKPINGEPCYVGRHLPWMDTDTRPPAEGPPQSPEKVEASSFAFSTTV